MKVGHIFNEFCPRNSVFRYWPVANPHVDSAVYCFHRTNADLFPHGEVYTERLASRLRAIHTWPWKQITRPVASCVHRVSWKRFLNRSQIDLIHVQFGDKAVRFLPMLERAKLPLVVTFHGSDVNCATYSASSERGLRELFSRTSLCHFVSHDLRRKAIQLGCRPEIARTIHLGAPARTTSESKSPSLRVDDCHFYCVASLLPCKGHETLLTAFRQVSQELRGATLHLLGEGPLRNRLQWLCKSMDIEERVLFHGQVENQAVIAMLREDADIVVLPSQHDDQGNQEGLPASLQEAASLGIPCIGTDCGGIAELIIDGITGMVVPQRDVDQLAAAMIRLASQPGLRAEMGRAAFKRGRESFNLQNFYAEITECYHEVLSCGPLSGAMGTERRMTTEPDTVST